MHILLLRRINSYLVFLFYNYVLYTCVYYKKRLSVLAVCYLKQSIKLLNLDTDDRMWMLKHIYIYIYTYSVLCKSLLCNKVYSVYIYYFLIITSWQYFGYAHAYSLIYKYRKLITSNNRHGKYPILRLNNCSQGLWRSEST